MSPNELLKELEAGKFRPVYYFYGSEDYRIKEAERSMVRKFLPRQSWSIGHNSFSVSKSNLKDILTELSMMPMIGEKQAFTIKDIQSLTPQNIEKLLSLLDPPDPNRMVILISPAAKTPRKGTKTKKLLTEKAAAVEFKKYTKIESEKKIRFMLRDNEIEIDDKAMKMLIEMSGGDMGGIIGEVNKIIDFVGKGAKVSSDNVAEICSDFQSFQNYELGEKVASFDLDIALGTLHNLLNKGDRASTLLYQLGDFFLGVYLVKNGKPVRLGKLDQSWKYRKHTGLFSSGQLEEIIQLIAMADRDLRGNIKPESMILEKLIINIYSICKEKSSSSRAV